MKWNTIIAIVALVALLAVFAGIWVISSSDITRIDDPAYIKWEYDGDQTTMPSCITGSGNQCENVHMISSWEEYGTYLDITEQNCHKYESAANYEGYDDSLIDAISEHNMDTPQADFFDQYNLAVVDFCDPWLLYLESHIEEVTIRGDSVSVAIYLEALAASTADNPGNVYWIRVPKDCTKISVTYDRNIESNPIWD